jgi:hypothetical protein
VKGIGLIAALAWLAFTSAVAAQDAIPKEAPKVVWTIPPEAEIPDILVDRIDTRHEAVGIVVGVIDAKGQRVISCGYWTQLSNDSL